VNTYEDDNGVFKYKKKIFSNYLEGFVEFDPTLEMNENSLYINKRNKTVNLSVNKQGNNLTKSDMKLTVKINSSDLSNVNNLIYNFLKEFKLETIIDRPYYFKFEDFLDNKSSQVIFMDESRIGNFMMSITAARAAGNEFKVNVQGADYRIVKIASNNNNEKDKYLLYRAQLISYSMLSFGNEKFSIKLMNLFKIKPTMFAQRADKSIKLLKEIITNKSDKYTHIPDTNIMPLDFRYKDRSKLCKHMYDIVEMIDTLRGNIPDNVRCRKLLRLRNSLVIVLNNMEISSDDCLYIQATKESAYLASVRVDYSYISKMFTEGDMIRDFEAIDAIYRSNKDWMLFVTVFNSRVNSLKEEGLDLFNLLNKNYNQNI
jgi:hypothetical protein